MNLPIQLCSIGFACQQLQLPIPKIRATADRLGIQESRINGVAHFHEADIELIRQTIAAELRASHPILDQRSNIQ